MAKRTKTKQTVDARRPWPYLFWTLAAGIWALATAALVSYHPADPPGFSAVVAPDPVTGRLEIHNWVGRAGAFVAHELYVMIGPGVWIIVAGALIGLLIKAAGRKITQPILRTIGVVLMAIAASSIVSLMLPDNPFALSPARWWLIGGGAGNGGLLATFINGQLEPRFAVLGTGLILGVGFWVGAILTADRWLVWVVTSIVQLLAAVSRIRLPKPVLVGSLSGLGRLPGISGIPGWLRPGGRGQADDDEKKSTRKRRFGREDQDHLNENAGGLGATQAFDPDQEIEAEIIDDADQDAEPDEDDVVDASASDAPGAYTAQKQFDPDALRAKIKAMPINFATRLKAGEADASAGVIAAAREMDLSGYEFPGLDLLFEPEHNFTDEMEDIVRDQAVLLESALNQYRIEGEVVDIDSGPVITLFEVRLAPGTKVSQISRISSDLARALKAQNIRIVPNTAGKDTVGIEVPNLRKEKVRLKELITAEPEAASSLRLPMYLGKDASGNALIQDLTAMPHMLIAGTTGSGKSVCINSIIASFLYTKKPDELKLVLVDPKMVELTVFKDIPHLMCPVVTEMSKATAILEWATTKMDERYELLAEAGVRDIAGYNKLSWEELKERFEPATEAEEARIPKKLPYLVFVIDELADMILTNKEVEGFIVRLAQKARAVGMHLILATQRPQANVVTGLIKGNMPCRISFKVASGLDSRIVLDQKGAELLLGQGDMLFLSPRSVKLARAQGTLVEDTEIRRMVKFLKTKAEQHFEPQLMQIKTSNMPGEDELGDEKDPLFDEAVQIVLETKRGSVSLLQRRLAVGYSRASRLIEQMAIAGLLGDYKGSQAREVTITIEEWEALKAQAEADALAAEAQGTVFETETEDVESDDEQEVVDESEEEDEQDQDEDEDEDEVDDDEVDDEEDDEEFEEDDEEEEDDQDEDDEQEYEDDEEEEEDEEEV